MIRWAIILCLLLVGCSGGEKQIAQSSTDIVGLAHSSKARFEVIYKQAHAPVADTRVISSEALSGACEQQEIIEAVNTIITALPDVQDTTSVWLSVLRWLVTLSVIVGIIVLLFQTGAGAILKRITSWFARKRAAE